MTSSVQTKRLKISIGGSGSESELASHATRQRRDDAYSIEQELDELTKLDRKKPLVSRASRACRRTSQQQQQQQRQQRQRQQQKQQESDSFGVDDLSDETDQEDEDGGDDLDDAEFEMADGEMDDDDDEEEEDDDDEVEEDEEEDEEYENAPDGSGLRKRQKGVGKPKPKQQQQPQQQQQQQQPKRGANLQDQLAASGPAGVAAAAAIATVRKRRRPHTFETNPSVRKRQQTRLIRKLRACIDEYTARVGQQAVVLIAMPGKTAHNFKVFGAQPLESVVRSSKQEIMGELEQAVLEQTPIMGAGNAKDSNKHELPPLVIDGIPTPVEKMTQAQLRAFIPLMLKYSTGRGKPGWGKESTRPQWWPNTLPWANVRSDARDEDEKQRISWTTTLREIVTNCYKYHGREDLLPVFDETEEDEEDAQTAASGNGTTQATSNGTTSSNHQQHLMNDENKHQRHLAHNQVGILRSQRPLGSAASARLRNQQTQQQHQHQHHEQQHHLLEHQQPYYTTSAASLQQGGYVTTSVASGGGGAGAGQTFMQTIQNADGSVSLIQVDPANSQILTLPDGTQVRAVRLQTCLASTGGGGQSGGGGGGDDHEVQLAGGELQTIDPLHQHHHQGQHLLEPGQQAEMGPDGQIILTSEDGTQSCYPMSQLVSIPASVYQQLAATGQPVQIITAESAASLAGAGPNAIQVHTIQEAQEISAAEAASESGGQQQQQQRQQVGDEKQANEKGDSGRKSTGEGVKGRASTNQRYSSGTGGADSSTNGTDLFA